MLRVKFRLSEVIMGAHMIYIRISLLACCLLVTFGEVSLGDKDRQLLKKLLLKLERVKNLENVRYEDENSIKAECR